MKAAPARYALDLGTNRILDTAAVLIVEGVDVFRLEERTSDGRLVVTFDVRSPNGEVRAMVRRNAFLHGADEFDLRQEPGATYLIERQSGSVIACVEEIGSRLLKVCGKFWVRGCQVEIDADRLVWNANPFRGSVTMGSRSGFEFTKTRGLF